jgi:glycosyltransferase involved in cell wall biosynthesis
MSDHNHITFVIPHKGRENMLIETLCSISDQQFELSRIGVVIVSQNESVSKEVLAFQQTLNLSIIHRPESETISALRNLGVASCHSEFLAFLDADIYLSSNWLEVMLATLQDRKTCVIVSAMQKNSNQAPSLERIRTALSNPVLDQAVDFLPGRNLFMTRATFERIGGFPEHLVTCEDYYFTNRASKLGELFYTSSAYYIHLGEDKDYNEMFKKEIWRGQSNLQSIGGREISLRELPSFVLPVAIMGLVLIALFSMLAGYYSIALLSLSAALLPFSIYVIRLSLLLKDSGVSPFDTLRFYLFYFPARAIGTIGGIFKSFNSTSHRS